MNRKPWKVERRMKDVVFPAPKWERYRACRNKNEVEKAKAELEDQRPGMYETRVRFIA